MSVRCCDQDEELIAHSAGTVSSLSRLIDHRHSIAHVYLLFHLIYLISPNSVLTTLPSPADEPGPGPRGGWDGDGVGGCKARPNKLNGFIARPFG